MQLFLSDPLQHTWNSSKHFELKPTEFRVNPMFEHEQICSQSLARQFVLVSSTCSQPWSWSWSSWGMNQHMKSHILLRWTHRNPLNFGVNRRVHWFRRGFPQRGTSCGCAFCACDLFVSGGHKWQTARYGIYGVSIVMWAYDGKSCLNGWFGVPVFSESTIQMAHNIDDLPFKIF